MNLPRFLTSAATLTEMEATAIYHQKSAHPHSTTWWISHRDQLVNGHAGWLCDFIMGKYGHMPPALHPDIIQTALISLTRAAEEWQPGLGSTFKSFASNGAISKVRTYLTKDMRTVRLPAQRFRQILTLRRVIHEFEDEHNRTPTDEEIESLTFWPLPVIRRIQAADTSAISLDEAVYAGADDQKLLVGDVLSDPGAHTSVDVLQITDRYKQFIGYLLALREFVGKRGTEKRPYKMFCRRFGLDGKPAEGSKAIGERFDVSWQAANSACARFLLQARKNGIHLHTVHKIYSAIEFIDHAVDLAARYGKTLLLHIRHDVCIDSEALPAIRSQPEKRHRRKQAGARSD